MHRPYLVAPCLLAAMACAAPVAFGQDATKPPPNPDVVTVDLSGRGLGGTLPFDQAFDLRGAVDTATDAVVLRYGPRSKQNEDANAFLGSTSCAVWIRQSPLDGTRARESHFVLDIPSLKLTPNEDYLLEFSLYELTSLPQRQQTGSLRQPADDTACLGLADVAALGTPTNPAPVRLTDQVFIRGDTDIEFTQRFDTDVGAVWAPGAEYWGASSGVHFFFLRPVNKKLDLAELDPLASIPHRLTLYGGLAINQLGAGNAVKPAWTVGSPMLGIGIRGPFYWSEHTPFAWVLRPIRLNTGLIWFRQDDPNPLVDELEVKRDWFWSLTADLDLTSILGPFVALVKK